MQLPHVKESAPRAIIFSALWTGVHLGVDEGHDEQHLIQYRLGRIHIHEIGEKFPFEIRRF